MNRTALGKRPCGASAGLVLWFLATASGSAATASAQSVDRFGVFEKTFTHSGSHANPYRELSATATFVGSGGQTRTIPLFWDGGATWRVRFSPDALGTWTWSTTSANTGLDGVTGSFSCVASSRKGGIRAKAGAPYHFERQDGSPFWFMGDTQWLLYSDDPVEELNRATNLEYLDVRASQNYNAIQAALYVNWSNSGGPQFTSLASEALNPGFFREVDFRLRYVNQLGMVAGVFLSWGDLWSNFPSDEARLRFAQYVTARYSAYDVFFIIANEWSDGLARAQASAIGQAIDAAEPHGRLIGNHDVGTSESFAEESGMSFGDFQQLYKQVHQSILVARDHSKPVVNAEFEVYLRDSNDNGVIQKSNSFTPDDVRWAAWDIAMAGGYFFTAYASTYYGGYRDKGPFEVHDPRDDPVEDDIQQIRKFFDKLGWLEWWKLASRDALLTSPDGRDGDRIINNVDGSFSAPPARTFWALAETGKQYVAYMRGFDGPHTLSLGTTTAATYTVFLYNPRTGAFSELEPFTGTGPVLLDPPDALDWVYVLLGDGSGGSLPPPPPPPPPGGTTVNFQAEADTYIPRSDPNRNFGTAGRLSVGAGTNARVTYIRFNVSGLPIGATITDARLIVACSRGSGAAGGGGAIRLFAPTLATWSETAPTWNSPLQGSDASGDLSSLGPVTEGQTYSFLNLQSAITGNGKVTFVIRSTKEDAASYRSSEYGTASQRPVLRITYTS